MPQPRSRRLALLVLLLPLLAACNETGPGGFAARASGRATPIALLSIDGASADVQARFQSALAIEARRHDLVLVEAAASARYTLKGYVTAYGGGSVTRVDWVWDLFDGTQRRARRLNGAETLARASGTDAEAWRALDDSALAALAVRSMDGVVGFLDGDPDAVAGRVGEPVGGVAGTAN